MLKHLMPPTTLLCVQRLSQADNKEAIKTAVYYCPFVLGIHPQAVNIPLKGPVMRKVCPYHDVTMLREIEQSIR